jgi:amidase
VLLYEFKQGMKDYLATRPGAPRNLAELIAFNEKEAARELEHFGQDILIQAEAKGSLEEREYLNAHARARMLAGPRGIDAVLRKHKLDAIIAPTVGLAWTTDLVNGDHYTGGAASQSAAIVGYPHITVPAGFVQGLPVGVSFISKAWSEPTLIRLAYSYEQATRARRPPNLEPATP